MQFRAKHEIFVRSTNCEFDFLYKSHSHEKSMHVQHIIHVLRLASVGEWCLVFVAFAFLNVDVGLDWIGFVIVTRVGVGELKKREKCSVFAVWARLSVIMAMKGEAW